MINIIVWLVVGGVIGWLASIVMKTDAQQGVALNVVVGIIGAAIGGWVLAPLFGTGTINQDNLSFPSLLVSLLGAVILLAIVNLVRRGTVRSSFLLVGNNVRTFMRTAVLQPRCAKNQNSVILLCAYCRHAYVRNRTVCLHRKFC